MAILRQQQIDAFIGVLRQTLAGFDGVVQRIAEDDAEILRIER